MLFEIEHITDYQYTAPVRLGEQLIRLTPRPSAALKVLVHTMPISPAPTSQIEAKDFEGNSIVLATFEGQTDHLRIVNLLSLETFELDPIDWGAPRSPFLGASDISLVTSFLTRENPSDLVGECALEMFRAADQHPLWFARSLNRFIHQEFSQVIREHGAPLTPGETFVAKRGACRDFAVLFMDACRSVGIPARFVSGYQQADIDVNHRNLHAWVEVYVPGLGWIGFDPTTGESISTQHVALAACANPANAAPVIGSFWSVSATSRLECSLALSAR